MTQIGADYNGRKVSDHSGGFEPKISYVNRGFSMG